MLLTLLALATQDHLADLARICTDKSNKYLDQAEESFLVEITLFYITLSKFYLAFAQFCLVSTRQAARLLARLLA